MMDEVVTDPELARQLADGHRLVTDSPEGLERDVQDLLPRAHGTRRAARGRPARRGRRRARFGAPSAGL